MTDPLARLAVWLQPFSITPNADALSERHRLVSSLAEDDNLDPHTLVSTSYGLGDHEAIATAIGQIDASVVVEGREQLVATLAAAALTLRLTDATHDDATVLALLVQSANFLGLEPAVPEVPTAAAAALAGLARRQRQRIEAADTAREVRALLATATTSAVAVDETAASVKAAVQNRDQAMRALAKRIESLVNWTGTRLALVEEELDLLWWCRRGRTTTDEPWEQLAPPRRAALAATELADLLTQLPAPPSARSLLREALGADADKDTSIAEVVTALEVPEGARRLLLMPLTTFAIIVGELRDDETAAARLFAKTVPLDPAAPRPLIDVAEQVLRERQIAALLW